MNAERVKELTKTLIEGLPPSNEEMPEQLREMVVNGIRLIGGFFENIAIIAEKRN